MIYFWREKNALRLADRFKVYDPSREELENELVLKVEQKLSRIDVVFDAGARAEYYEKDKKPKKSLAGLNEKQIQQLLGTRVAVDFLQLCFDLADFYGVDKNFTYNAENLSVEKLKKKVKTVVESLKSKNKSKEDRKMRIENLFGCARELASLCDVSWEEVETEQLKKEEEEGSFVKGKYVDYE